MRAYRLSRKAEEDILGIFIAGAQDFRPGWKSWWTVARFRNCQPLRYFQKLCKFFQSTEDALKVWRIPCFSLSER